MDDGDHCGSVSIANRSVLIVARTYVVARVRLSLSPSSLLLSYHVCRVNSRLYEQLILISSSADRQINSESMHSDNRTTVSWERDVGRERWMTCRCGRLGHMKGYEGWVWEWRGGMRCSHERQRSSSRLRICFRESVSHSTFLTNFVVSDHISS